ncbi:MAG: glycosyl transferase [Deltaproteobacteria bacterium]|nr:glycosyl transferase [Deltaproteobacteria bacterium]
MDRIIETSSHINRADIIVGMPSYNEAKFIPYVTRTVDLGLTTYFPDMPAAIINVDNHSTDGTKEAFMSTPTRTAKIYISNPPGIKGKGNNARNLFYAACELQAKAVVMVDADLTSITPRWIQYLGEPLFSGFDYVTPIYIRHKFDASITNHLCYPILRTLFRLRIRQPIGGDFGFSGRLAKRYLAAKLWSKQAAGYGIDVWMTTNAIASGYPICQTFLGSPKSHRVKDPARHLKPMFKEVAWTLFDLIIEFESLWKHIKPSTPTPIFGFGLGENENPPVPNVDTDHLYETFITGCDRYKKEWEAVISDENLREILKAKRKPKKLLYYPTWVWCRTMFDFAVAYRNRILPHRRLVDSMVPLYYSRQLSFFNKMKNTDTKACEEYIENINRVFEQEKKYLLTRWEERRGR